MQTDGRTVLILGGTSEIGFAAARIYAKSGWNVLLAARDLEAARRNAADLTTRYATSVSVHGLDILSYQDFQPFLNSLLSVPDTVVCAIGELGDQRRAETDSEYAAMLLRSNFEGPALLLGMLAERLLARGSGTIVGISSVAGDRGRAGNYVYGSAKAGFTAFLSGLRSRLAPAGLRAVTVKPGYVRTPMTAGVNLPRLLTAEPAEVGLAIFKAAEQGGDVIYVRPIWRYIMTMYRILPEPMFKRLRL